MSHKLLFLLTSLEPGKSGVGDVTRHLAAELADRGEQVLLIAVNDPDWTSSEAAQQELSSGVELARFSNKVPWKVKVPLIQKLIEKFKPDLISLQFVCYGFEPRGLTFSITPWLIHLTKGSAVQVMFHELWIGQNQKAPFKEKLVGWLQKMAIVDMLRRLRPVMVHSSNPTYVAMLEHQGVKARWLPLPTAVSIQHEPDPAWLYQEINKRGVRVNDDNRREFWLFGFFGTLHPIWPPEPLLGYLRKAAVTSGKKPVFLAIGRLGAGTPLWEQMAKQHAEWATFISLGAQTEARVSHFFHEIDFSIATTPWEIMGKSSSAVTMLEHGVPVIVNRQLSFGLGTDGGPAEDPYLFKMDAQLPERLIRGIPRRPPLERSPAVAGQFLADCFPQSTR